MQFRFLALCVVVLINCHGASSQSSTPQPTVASDQYENTVAFDPARGQYDFFYYGEEDTIRYTYRSDRGGTLESLQCIVNGSYLFTPSTGGIGMMAQGSKIYPWTAGVGYMLDKAETQADTLVVGWKMYYGNDTLRYHYNLHIQGRSLVIDAESEQNCAHAFFLDRSRNTLDPSVVHVPYLTLFNILYTNGSFCTLFFDWEKTNASKLVPISGEVNSSSVRYAQNALYEPNTAGERRALSETLYLTVSPTLHEVFPDIPNPTSQYKEVSANHMIFDSWTSHFSDTEECLRKLKEDGIHDIWLIQHAWQNGGYDNKYPDVLPANPEFGGNEGLKALSKLARDQGYLFSLHENYVDYYPNAASYKQEHVALNSDGSLQKGWYNPTTGIQAYKLKPSLASNYLEDYAPDIHALFSTTASFLDVHSAISPSNAIDYDASGEGWCSFRKTLEFYRELAGKLRNHHEGPVSGEGKHHFLNTGYYDDIEAQINTGKYGYRSQGRWLPLLVDFDLRKMHGKAVVHGVGYYERYFCDETGGSNFTAFNREHTLKYIATELIYGHGGFIPTPKRHNNFVEAAKLEQRHVLPVQRLYARSEPVEITYHQDGKYMSASEYIATYPDTYANTDHANFMSQVRVKYENGLVVYANRHPDEAWDVTMEKKEGWCNYHALIEGKDSLGVGEPPATDYHLPAQSGWLVYSPKTPVSNEDEDHQPEAPSRGFSFTQIYPNPFKNHTHVEYSIGARSRVTLELFDLTGTKVRTLINKVQPAGQYRVKIKGAGLTGGVYLCRLKAGSYVENKKLLLLK